MGVEGFVGHYLRVHKFKNVELRYIPGRVNNLGIDCNSLLHNSAAETYAYGDFEDEKKLAELQLVDPAVLEAQFLERIIHNLKKVVQTFRASDNLLISIDGPATISKILQQRSRRYKGSVNVDSKMLFRTSSISPGTDIMFKIDAAIQNWLLHNYIYLSRNIIYSNHLMPLEGETKLFNYLRDNTYNWTGNTVIYGLDTDLVFLSMLCPLNNVYLSRNNENDIININAFRTAINTRYLQSSSTVDFVWLSYMIGNDFLPRVTAFSDINTAYEQFEIWYKALRSGIVSNGVINWINFSTWLRNMSAVETRLLQGVASTTTTHRNPVLDASWRVSVDGVQIFDYEQFRRLYYSHALNPKVTKLPPDVLNNFVPNSEWVRDMCRNYLSTMVWNLQFYTRGVDDLNLEYYYAYNYAPLLSDLRDYAAGIADAVRNNVSTSTLLDDVSRGAGPRIMNALQQLLCIIPPNNWDVLPAACRTYTDYGSPIYDIFCTTFEIDMYGKNKDYQGIALLPPLDADTIFNQVQFPADIVRAYTPVGDYVYVQTAATDEYRTHRAVLSSMRNGGEPRGRGRGRGRGGTSAPVSENSSSVPVPESSVRGRGRGRGRGGDHVPRGRGRSGDYVPRGRGRGGDYVPRGRGRGGAAADATTHPRH